MNTHQPTWDYCQQLLRTLFTTKEQDRILAAARKNVIGLDGLVTTRPDVIDDSFPLRRPDWDPNTYEGRGNLSTYRQTLMRSLREAARKPTNLAKVLKKPLGPLSSKQSLVQGANGSSYRSWTTSRTMDLGKGEIKHSFLVIPNCPSPLMGRDLLTKLRAQITFEETGPEIAFLNPSVQPLTTSVLTIRAEDEYRLFTNDPLPVESQDTDFWLRLVPEAWAETAGLGLSTLQAPVVVELKTTAVPVRVRQYPMSQEAKKGITPHIRKLLQQGVLVKCQSAWNTPLLPVKKPGTGDYRPVQDLRAVNSQVEVIHPTVPNPYNLLSTLSPERVWYTVLDLKDAFFCLSLHPASQPLFAFEWSDPEAGISGQLTWTRLPQGFKNSPTIFDEALHQDLSLFRSQHPQVTLLQYVDNILIAGKTEEDYNKDRVIPFTAPGPYWSKERLQSFATLKKLQKMDLQQHFLLMTSKGPQEFPYCLDQAGSGKLACLWKLGGGVLWAVECHNGAVISVTLEFRFSGSNRGDDGSATTLGYYESPILSLQATVAVYDDLPVLSLLALLLLLLQAEPSHHYSMRVKYLAGPLAYQIQKRCCLIDHVCSVKEEHQGIQMVVQEEIESDHSEADINLSWNCQVSI
ncbi:uncharacterized protein LOC126007082 [Suncus etruscus]|uniref:uncharacterized protein LOC126007082 n=1 Tax=Suncus etruscus TaxID=109475 RepID=UPI00210F510B|nr:uncharacterized protein LOC126007082 [Suncus etruscus]